MSNSIGTLSRWPVRYALALATSALSLAFRLALAPVLGSDIPYITFFPAVLVSAWFGGLGPGLTAVFLSGVTVIYVLVPPPFAFKPLTTTDVVGLVLFYGIGFLVSFLTGGWREKTKRLRESEERLRLAHRAARSGIWDLDLESGRLYWSDEIYPLHAFPAGTTPSFDDWLATVHPDDRDFARDQLSRQIIERGEVDFEFRIIRNGEVRWMMNLGQVTERKKGRPTRLTGIARDITDHRRAEEERRGIQDAQRQSESRLRFAIGAARFGEWRLDLDTRRIDASPRYSEILGCCDSSMECTFEDLIERVRPESRGTLNAAFLQSVERGHDWEFEVPIVRADGTDAWIWGKGGIFRDASGHPRYVAGLLADVTDRKRAEQAVIESGRIYRTIGEAINYGVWICDAEGRNTYASESFLELVGMTQEDCAAFGWGTVLHPDDRDRTIAAWKQCVKEEGVWDIEHRYLGLDGKYHHILARGLPVRDEQGRLLCWAGINLDITRLRTAEQERIKLFEELKDKAEELERSNRELEEFAYVASHDLQEPLRTINIYTQLLLRRLQGSLSEELGAYAAFIQSSVGRMERLIRDVLAYSRTIHADQMPAQRTEAGAALQQALTVLQPLIDETHTRIEIEHLPAVMADEMQLALVFQNIVSNSIKYRKPGEAALIGVASSVNGASCVISIRDNGIGFNPEYSSRVFGLFKRLHRDEYPGTGIGLAICKRIIERYGGEIWAESQPGQGTTVSFALPSAQACAHHPD